MCSAIKSVSCLCGSVWAYLGELQHHLHPRLHCRQLGAGQRILRGGANTAPGTPAGAQHAHALALRCQQGGLQACAEGAVAGACYDDAAQRSGGIGSACQQGVHDVTAGLCMVLQQLYARPMVDLQQIIHYIIYSFSRDIPLTWRLMTH